MPVQKTACAFLAAAAVALPLGVALAQSGGKPPEAVRMTWFGITNWHYQIGDLGIVFDGAVSFNPSGPGIAVKQSINPKLVDRVHDALTKTGSIDVLVLGHLHDDHSLDSPYWAKKTNARYFAAKDACAAAIAYGAPADRCTAIAGGETIKLNQYVTVRVVRWNHSVVFNCKPTPNDTFRVYGFLFTVDTPKKQLTFFVNDSGAGAEINKERIDDGVNRGAPLANLTKAMADARLASFELWQGGPEGSFVSQARVVLPAFKPRWLIPHHFGARGPFDLLGGLHYAYTTPPMLEAVLKAANVPQVVPQNYFDAFVYDADGVRAVPNAEVKAAMGLPATGPGPKPQGSNARADFLECPGD